MDKRAKEKRYNELHAAFKANTDGRGPKPTEAESDERIRLFYELSGTEPVDLSDVTVNISTSFGRRETWHPEQKKRPL